MGKESFKVDKSLVLRPQASEPTNPQEGQIYHDGTLNKIRQYINGAWVDLTSTEGVKNYIENPNAENGLSGWEVYSNISPSALPDVGCDLSTTAASLSLTQNTTALFNIIGDTSFSFQKVNTGNSAQGQGFKYRFNIDNADKNKNLRISFTHTDASALYDTGDYQIFIWDVLNSQLLTVESSNGQDGGIDQVGVNGIYNDFYANFQATDSDEYIFLIHCTSTDTLGFTVYGGDFKLSPDSLVPGAIITEWKSYTPTFNGFGNTTNVQFYYKRSGSDLYIKGIFTAGSTSASIASITLPTGLSIKLAGHITNNYNVGYLLRGAASSSNISYAIADNGAVNIQFSTRGAANPLTPANGNTILDTGESAALSVGPIPIQEWSAGAMLSTTEVGLQSVKLEARLSTDQTGEDLTAGAQVDWDTSTIDTHNILNTSTGVVTIPADGFYFINSNVATTALSPADSTVTISILKNAGTIARIDEHSSDDNPDLGISWAGYLLKNDTITIEVINATDSNAGFLSSISSLSIFRIPDFTTFSVYGESDYIESFSPNANYSITVNQYGDLTSIELTPGEWDISAVTNWFSNGATTTTHIRTGFSTTSGNSSAGMSNGDALVNGYKNNSTGFHDHLTVPPKQVIVTTPTTYYLKVQAANSITNLQISGRISARRIK